MCNWKLLQTLSQCRNDRMLFWQIIVSITTFMAYMIHYFCRSQLYVVIDEYRNYLNPNNERDAQKWIGIMFAFGYVSYVIGKISFALLTDTILKSAVKPLLFCITISPLITILFTININNYTFRIFLSIILWSLLRGSLASGWIAVVKIIVNWIPYSYYGQMMAFQSLSWLFGDAIARAVLGWIYDDITNNNWRIVFYVAAFITSLTIIPTFLLIKDLPTQKNLPLIKNHVHSENVRNKNDIDLEIKYNSNTNNDKILISGMNIISDPDESDLIDKKHISKCSTIWILFSPLLSSLMFWMALIMNFQYIFIRELFNVYFIDYLEKEMFISKKNASLISSLFPLIGAFSVILCGIWIDRIKSQHYKYIILPIFSIINGFCLAILAFIEPHNLSISFVILIVCLYGFSLLGPYSVISGVMVQFIGGQKKSAMVSGFVSASGYCAGIVVSLFSSFYNYQFLYMMATFCSQILTICGIIIFIYNKRINDKSKYKPLIEKF